MPAIKKKELNRLLSELHKVSGMPWEVYQPKNEDNKDEKYFWLRPKGVYYPEGQTERTYGEFGLFVEPLGKTGYEIGFDLSRQPEMSRSFAEHMRSDDGKLMRGEIIQYFKRNKDYEWKFKETDNSYRLEIKGRNFTIENHFSAIPVEFKSFISEDYLKAKVKKPFVNQDYWYEFAQYYPGSEQEREKGYHNAQGSFIRLVDYVPKRDLKGKILWERWRHLLLGTSQWHEKKYDYEKKEHHSEEKINDPSGSSDSDHEAA